MQARTEIENNPYYYWEIYNGHSDVSMKNYYLEVQTNHYRSGFSSREIIGEYSKNLQPKVYLENIDPVLAKIVEYLSESENFFQNTECAQLTVQDIQIFQRELKNVFKELNNTTMSVVDLKDRFPKAPEQLFLANRELIINSCMSSYNRLNDDLNHLLKFRNMKFPIVD